jgi:hypothetical protein
MHVIDATSAAESPPPRTSPEPGADRPPEKASERRPEDLEPLKTAESKKHPEPKVAAAKPKVPGIDPLPARRERALRSLRRAFVAEQRVSMKSDGSDSESRAVFQVFPGEGYRLRLRGPLDVTLLDVAVRCSRYRYSVPLKLKKFEGPIKEAAKTVGHFPVEPLFSLFDPNGRGTWNKETFTADRGALVAVLHPKLDAFASWRVNDAYGRPIKVRIEAFAEDADGYLLPKRMVMELPDGRTVILDAERFMRDVPSIAEAIDEITC